MTNKIPFTSVLQPIQNIQERNNKFHSLSDEDKRREISFDLAALILSGNISGAHGEYWSSKLRDILEPDNDLYQLQLMNYLPECEVCQRGGMMLSQIRLGNNVNYYYNSYSSCGTEDIIEGFHMGNFHDMECEYENNVFDHPYENNTTEKLLNITLNVIANGNFDTKDKTDYIKKWGIK